MASDDMLETIIDLAGENGFFAVAVLVAAVLYRDMISQLILRPKVKHPSEVVAEKMVNVLGENYALLDETKDVVTEVAESIKRIEGHAQYMRDHVKSV